MNKMIFILLLSPLIAFCQDSIEIPTPFEYQVIDTFPGNTADQVYSKSKLFITEKYMNPKRMIQLDDPVSKTLVIKDARFGIVIEGKGSGTVFGAPMSVGYVYFDIKIEVKDNKSRVTLYHFVHLGSENYQSVGGSLNNEKPGFLMTKKQWRMIKYETAKRSVAFLDAFKKSVNSSNEF